MVVLLSLAPYADLRGTVNVAHASDITVDNGATEYSEREGTWSTVSAIGNGGTDVRRSNTAGAGVMYWLPAGADSGYYTVQIYKVVTADGDPNAVIGVRHKDGAESFTQDWTSGASEWITLGTYYFTPGNADTCISLVRGKRFGGSGYVTADAVKFIPAPTYTPAPPPAFDAGAPTPPAFLPSGYTLAFMDDFNGSSLDSAKWDTYDITSANGAYRPENVTVSGGNLQIAMKKETYGGKSYTSGGVLSKPSFGYGYYEARLKFSGSGSGWHQSFWLYTYLGVRASTPDNYGEVDIIETDSSNTGKYSTNYHDWHWLSAAHDNYGGQLVTTDSLSNNYHTFGVWYTDSTVKFYLDGVYKNEINISASVKSKLNIILNAVQYETMNDANLPGYYNVDWVRYFAAPASASNPQPTGNTLFSDDFESGSYSNWTSGAGTWSVGTDGTKVLSQTDSGTSGRAFAGNAAWTDYTVEARVKANELPVNSASGILARATADYNNYYWLRLHQSGKVQLYKKVSGGTPVLLQETAQSVGAGTWNTLKLVVKGSAITGYVNGVQKIAATDSGLTSGLAGVSSYQQSFSVDDVRVASIPLFSDDFESGGYSNWTSGAGTWSVGTDGTKVLSQTDTGTSGRIFAGNAAWSDYTVEARVKANELPVNSASGILARATADYNNYYWLRLHQSGKVQLYKKVSGGTPVLLQETAQSVGAGTWNTLKLAVNGSAITGYVNGVQKIAVTDSSLTGGLIGVSSYQQSFSVDDVTVGRIGS
ncbi:family 16 glycoside hydrolase [Paenibacillus thalictri]|uniref:Glycosyl hydrolase family protein n=1 Tax=Paenibacillus thalictri TaxID=2527873 RepID=A0A4Q9DG53_9BACL|nr:family 16 glycoside hydrolase [Paenibacillus thalictri]TBL68354.1 glycosyl hydrolase family protein [Paenibacillus thalictri]